MKKLLLTGRPRSGKSSLIQNSLIEFEHPIGGFAVQRLTRNRETWAFRILDLNDEAYVTHLESNKLYDDIAIFMTAQGKWQGETAVFDGKGRWALERCLGVNQLVIMDELGIFERDALAFQALVYKILDSDLSVLGVIKSKSNLFLDAVRSHNSVSILDIDTQHIEMSVQDLLTQVKN